MLECRICGHLAAASLHKHVHTAHGLTSAEYLETFPSAPLLTPESTDRLRQGSKRGRERAAARGVKAAQPSATPKRPKTPGVDGRTQAANEFALRAWREYILPLYTSGLPLSQIAEKLNEQGCQTRHGKRWTTDSVRRVAEKAEEINWNRSKVD